jgi:broad specificity phosphatase PhoE
VEQNTRDGASVECPIYLQPDLRERQFGDFELQPSANYEEVWKHDAMDPKHTMFGVESVTELAMRVKTCVDMAERHFTDMDVVMVSHGDSLQVLQTVLAGVDCAKHRSLPHLETCELRLMNP